MRTEIEIKAKDSTGAASASAKKNIRSVVEESAKANKQQRQNIARATREFQQNSYREIAQAQKTGIAHGAVAATAVAGAQTGMATGLAQGVQGALHGAGMGGVAGGVGKLHDAGRKMFGGGANRRNVAGSGGSGGAKGGGAGGGGGASDVGESAASKIAPALAGTGAVIGVGLGIINSIGRKYDELIEGQEGTYRMMGKTTANEKYGIDSGRVAQARLAASEAYGKNISNKQFQSSMAVRAMGLFGMDAGAAGSLAGNMEKSGLKSSQAEKFILAQSRGGKGGAVTDKIAAKSYFETLGHVLEESSHDGFLSGMKDAKIGEGLAKSLSSFYGMKVNGQDLSPQRASAIFQNFNEQFQNASKLQGGPQGGVMFAAVKNQIEKETGKDASIIDVMQRLEAGATGKNMTAFQDQLKMMGLSNEDKTLMYKDMGLSIAESKRLAEGGMPQIQENARGKYFANNAPRSMTTGAMTENTILQHGDALSQARNTIQRELVKFAGVTAEKITELVDYIKGPENKKVQMGDIQMKDIDIFDWQKSKRNVTKRYLQNRGVKF